jgi:hypothetical protein
MCCFALSMSPRRLETKNSCTIAAHNSAGFGRQPHPQHYCHYVAFVLVTMGLQDCTHADEVSLAQLAQSCT